MSQTSDPQLPPKRRPRRTQEARRQETRQAILEGAMECLVIYGYAGATLARIARAAEVTTGALQHHFAGRRDLLKAVVHEGYAILVDYVGGHMPLEGALDARVHHAIEAMITGYASAPALAAFEVVAGARADPNLTLEHLQIVAPYTTALDAQWLQAFADADPDAARTALHVARTCILGLVLSAASGLSEIEAATVEGLKQSVVHLLSR